MIGSMPHAKLAALAWSGALLLGLPGCAGDGAGAKPASSADEATSSGAEETSAAGAEEGESEAAESENTPAAACEDGTCAPCGEGICPQGWYCDQGAQGGPACGWVPECAQKPSCGCLTRALPGCRCEEKEGGLHLLCG